MGLRAACISKYFYYPRQRCIFQNYSATFSTGTITAITGPSGAGKSTLLYCLAGLESVDSGDVLCHGHSILQTSADERSRVWRYQIGVVLQYPCLIPEVTVWDNIAMKGYIDGASYDILHERVTQLLDDIGLTDHADAYPDELSGGQQHRVALARMLLYIPDFLIMDELTAHLDADNARMLLELCVQYRDAYGCGIIMATHDQRVITYADQVCEIDAT